jgi:hypothetical protein
LCHRESARESDSARKYALGYGDVLPVTSVAQSLATLEAALGVLYITILIGRLVGLYSQHND